MRSSMLIEKSWIRELFVGSRVSSSGRGQQSGDWTIQNSLNGFAMLGWIVGLLLFASFGSYAVASEEEKPAAGASETKAKDSHADDHAAGGSHAAGHGHDELDNTHKDGSASLEAPVDIRTDKTLFSLVVFFLLLAGLYYFAWGPIMQGLSKRESDINALIANAEKSSADAASKLREYELKLEAAAQEAQSILARARKDAETAGQKIISEAQAEASRQKVQAVADIDSAKRVALSELSTKSTELAFTLAKRIVGRELKTEDHQQLVSDVLKQFPSHN
jgi:F-type H+-transporting ATPase subunit b